MGEIKTNDTIFKYYFYFIQERMNMFWKKYENTPPWTNDHILKEYKFTNVYRASDRVSQYLIGKVIYPHGMEYNNEDTLFRILLFKIFNKIETWEFLEGELKEITLKTFNLNQINSLLNQRIKKQPIFNNAYMMTGAHRLYNHLQFKHEKWLQMLNDEIINDGLLQKIINADSLEKVYILLRNCSFIGDFIAYQYTIDCNYSNAIDFNEDSFVKAGIGAIRGIKKCFSTLGNNSYEDAIKHTSENFEYYQQKYGFKSFKSLFGRKPTLIDLQNCFCETDKYLRAAIPELVVGNKRIKQRYKKTNQTLTLFFPPKWKLNNKIKNKCLQPSSKVLTIF